MSEKLNVDQASARMGLTRHQVYRRIQSGQLPASVDRTGKRRFLVAESDIEKFLAGDPGAPQDETLLLKAAAVASMLGVSVEMVRKLCDQGELAHRRSGNGRGHYFIPRESVEEYLSRS